MINKLFLFVSFICIVAQPQLAMTQPDILWENTFGGSARDFPHGMCQTNDAGFAITGDTWSYGAGEMDIFLVKTDSHGDTVWTKTFGGILNERGRFVQPCSQGGLILTGWTESFGSGDKDVWLIRIDANGDSLWSRLYGDVYYDACFSVKETSDKGFILVGKTDPSGDEIYDALIIRTDSDGKTLWTKTYGGSGIDELLLVQETPQGDFVAAGYSDQNASNPGDFWLVKLNKDGEMIWDKAYGGDAMEQGKWVQQTYDGGYIITGYSDSAGDQDLWLVKTDSLGNLVWSSTLGGPMTENGRCVQQTREGGYIVAGYTGSFGAGSADVWLVKTDANGNMLWDQTYGRETGETGRIVTITEDNGYAVAASTRSTDTGEQDIWLIRVASDPTDVQSGDNSTLPSGFTLRQNYPNPFNPTTTIDYTLQQTGHVALKVLNMLGQDIKVLVNEIQAPGHYNVRWDGRDTMGQKVGSGIYIYKIDTGQQSISKKMLLLK